MNEIQSPDIRETERDVITAFAGRPYLNIYGSSGYLICESEKGII
ncbi:hypothetical protein [Desulfonema magnum]|uniref:Uncharacterized protein n=1 Tax=Desulfonema magnum TaxID=45655 RepID=A0A975GP28_9BACT|nr:hypothetical protein [Desulfonema magnum]QTA88407.1 Uncharacterized protein dnm_044520 [Desulfonema magnum]